MLKYLIFLTIYNLIFGESQCEEKYFSEGQTILSGNQNILIEKQDIQTSLKSQDLNTDSIEFVQTLELGNEGQVIEVVLGKSRLTDYETQFCQLILVQAGQFKIHCQDGYNIQLIDYQFNFKNEYQIIFNMESTDICEQFFLIQDNKFLVVCRGNNYFKFLTVDNNNKTEILIQHNHNQNFTECKIIAGLIDYIKYIAYYECQNWVLFYFTEEYSIKTVNNEFLEENDQLLDISQCHGQYQKESYVLFLKFPQNYYILKLLVDSKLKIKSKILFPIFSCLSCLPNIRLIYNKKNNDLKDQEQMTYEYFLLLNFSTTEVPLQGLFIESKLILVYSTFVSIFHTSSLSQDYQITLKFFRQLYQSNLIYSLDQDSKNVHIYRINAQNKIVISKKAKLTYLLEFYIPYFFNLINIAFVSCSKVRVLEKNLKEWILEVRSNFTNDFLERENEMSYLLLKNRFLSNQPLTLWLDNESRNESIMDIIHFEKICYMAKFNSKNILEIIDLNIETVLISQDADQLIFYTCNKLMIKFKGIILSKEKKVLRFNYMLVALSEDNQSVFLFQFQSDVRLIKQFTFSQKIQNILQIDPSCICITFLQSSNNFYIKIGLNELTSFFEQNPQSNKPILFYQNFLKNLIIQDEQQIMIKKKDYYMYLNQKNTQIVSCQMQKNMLSLIILHHQDNRLVTYYEYNQRLIEASQYQLFDYTLIIPPIFGVSSKFLVFAAKKRSGTFLLIYDCTESEIFALKDVIQVSSTNFFLINTNLIYYDINNQLILKNLHEYQIIIQKNMLCNELNHIYKITLQISSIINPQIQKIMVQHKLGKILTCFELRLKLPFLKLEFTTIKTVGINLRDYFWGSIDDIKINQNQQKVKLMGPLIQKQRLNVCQYFGDQLFVIISTQNYTRIIHKEKEITFLFSWLQSSFKILFIKYLLQQSVYIIGTINDSKMRVDYFRFNDERQEIIQSLVFDVTIQQNQEINVEFQGDIGMFFNKESTYLFILFDQPVLLKQKRQSIHKQIQGCNNQYIFIYFENKIVELDFQIEIYMLKTDEFELIKNVTVNLEQYIKERQDLFLNSYQDINEIKINYCKYENGIYISEILLLGHYQYSFLGAIQIQGYVDFYIKNIIRLKMESKGASLVYFDEDRLILKSMFYDELFYYDLRTNDTIIDYISCLPQFQKFYFYNTTHQVIQNYLQIYIGQLNFELHIEEVQPEQGNLTIQLQARNRLSVQDFNITFIVQNETQSNLSLISYCFFGIFLLIILFILRRLILKQKKQQYFE